ncbi:hypothetical protein Y1Q_0016298 [Alligator mississippiensis]|uniref:Uncharacterized protein n=1 Tax=Alligator mississippiensis TaxID=8496 RepID=A0A151NR65_ALLMI|nr:hypothetical protein Y1Q_0016298 [Alligator mississippiensis]
MVSEECLADLQAWWVENIPWQDAWWVEDVTQQDTWQAKDVAQQDTWQEEDIACKEVRDWQKEERDWWWDWEDQVFQKRLLALKEWHIEDLEWQAVLLARTVEATEEYHWVLDTILALAVTFVLPTALPRGAGLLAPWQPPTA